MTQEEDKVRDHLKTLMEKKGVDKATLSKIVGRDASYFHQYLQKKTILHLPEGVRDALAVYFGATADAFRVKPSKKLPGMGVITQAKPPAGAVSVIEVDVSAGAGNGRFQDEESQVGNWMIPRECIQPHAGDINSIRIIRVVGDSMMPELYPGDRIMVNTTDTEPSPPGLFVVWDGIGLVVKRLMYIPNSKPPRIRLMSANKAYPDYELSSDECHIRGRVIGKWQWT
jgi:phage repressor protein C with HTH and peptisase S24 domain